MLTKTAVLRSQLSRSELPQTVSVKSILFFYRKSSWWNFYKQLIDWIYRKHQNTLKIRKEKEIIAGVYSNQSHKTHLQAG